MGDTADGSWNSRELGGYIKREQGRHEMDPEYEPMKQAEIEELSREAGRELTEREAYQYYKRRTLERALKDMLTPQDALDMMWHDFINGQEPKP